MAASARKLSMKTINQSIARMKYAVRGRMVAKAEGYSQAIKDGTATDLPFQQITACNIGNPHSLRQQPLTFFRQVLACCVYPDLMKSTAEIPADVKDRAQRILDDTSNSGMGAYSVSRGLLSIRQSVCAYLKERDGVSFDPEHIYLTNGASDGIAKFLNLLIASPKDGIMIPIPQYPLYSATIDALGGTQVPYYLDESTGWGLNVEELKRALDDSEKYGITVKAICVINPGNPTGQNLTKENLVEIVEFAKEHDLTVLADEVYQTNVYLEGDTFTSMRKALSESSGADSVCMASFHSTSKGFVGECGMRGGFMELVNCDPAVEEEFYKLSTVSLCPNLPGQVMVDTMVNPPQHGEPSFELYDKESNGILGSLKTRATMVVQALNELEGVTCNAVQGAMYAFPQITLPAAAIKAAEEAGVPADEFYATKLLDTTGICVVPGSGFGQAPGTFHYRTTILPPQDRMAAMTKSMKVFHEDFMKTYK
eukprot:m.212661 g.212661  ORF g.212661 m.212661 type:complete len:482 (+) comp33132_c2_seq2:166-1611(+)